MHDEELTNLFLQELGEKCEKMGKDLLSLEKEPSRRDLLDSLMRTSHSIKGGARVVGFPAITELFHVVEDGFVAAIAGKIGIDRSFIDLLLQIVDALQKDYKNDPLLKELKEKCQEQLKHLPPSPVPLPQKAPPPPKEEIHTFKIDPAYLDRLARLAGGTIIDAHWLQPFRESLSDLKQDQHSATLLLEKYREALVVGEPQPVLDHLLKKLTESFYDLQNELTARAGDFEIFQERHTALSEKLYQEVVSIRMRPFGDAIKGLPRLVRDLSLRLGKEVELKVIGEETPADREILERLEAPLMHLVRNSLDHGIQKKGTITITAAHKSGLLEIKVKDNGQGIDFDAIRKLVENGPTLTEKELENVILKPGFTTKKEATEISGRGVGLDVVHSIVQEMGGRLQIASEKGKGVEITLLLPLTLSLLHAFVVDVGGEAYAFPLARIEKAKKINKQEEIDLPLIVLKDWASDTASKKNQLPLNVVVAKDRAFVVDAFVGEKELVVQKLDPRLGKIKGVLAGALLEDGSPLLILDVDDFMRDEVKMKRVLVVDDSPTIRELLSRILLKKGYQVDTAFDGRDGLTHALAVSYDLIVTDLTMPEMDGYEMIQSIRRESRLKKTPIIVVSSRFLKEDIALAHEVGANRFLGKGNFDETTFLNTIEEFLT